MKLDTSNMKTVYVYPDGINYDVWEAPSWASDDYEIRQTCCCDECGEDLWIHYSEPFASCACGTTEWYD